MPVLDRYLENTYETLLNEEIKRNTASIGTIFFGNNLDEIISGVENYLFASLLYGSYTHLILTRKIFATVFYRTGKLYNKDELLYSAVKMYLFSEQYKDFIRLSNLEWNNISNIMILNADELWHQAKNIQENSKDIICIGILCRTGLYLNDKSFHEAEKYLLELSDRLPWNISNEYIDCLLNIYGRMNPQSIVEIIIKIIEKRCYVTATYLTRLISYMNYEIVPNSFLSDLCEAMKNGLPEIVSRNGDSQCIAVLVNAKPDIFSVLEKLPNNGLSGRQKLVYALNTNKGDWQAILLSELQIADDQFRANSHNGIYHGYATDPYHLISQIFDNKPSLETINIITEKLFPLCIEVLDTECHVETKDQCAKCLCTALCYYKKNKIEIPNALIKCIDNVSLTNATSFTMALRSYEGLWCRLLTLKIIAGVLDKQLLIQWCFSYSKKDIEERRALVECLKTYLQYSTNANTDVDSLIISIVFQCCEDKDVYIRATSCECLWYILESQYVRQAEEKLYEMTIDPAPAIKNSLLYICKENSPNHKTVIKKITINLINDANYMIRERAKKLLETNLEM